MIPFVDLKQQYNFHKDAFDKAMSDVCGAGAYVLGPEVSRFEKRFAEYLGVAETIGVASGTDALRLSCKALGIGLGDEVLIPANTFIATALAVYDLGATIVPVDVDPETYLLDLSDAESRITENTKAIIPVHLYGQCLDMDAIAEFTKKHNLLLVEDACQAHGAEWKGRRAGGFGATGCFSFYPAKNLGAFGDGGLISTNDPELARNLRLLRAYGSIEKYIHEIPGTNSRLDSIQAAVLNVKLDFLDKWNSGRFHAACRYSELLEGIDDVKTPAFDKNDPERHVFHLYIIQCEHREELMSQLGSRDIQCGIHYPQPIHLMQAFDFLGYKEGDFPVSEELAGRILSLPIFPEISDEQVEEVAEAIRVFYG